MDVIHWTPWAPALNDITRLWILHNSNLEENSKSPAIATEKATNLSTIVPSTSQYIYLDFDVIYKQDGELKIELIYRE